MRQTVKIKMQPIAWHVLRNQYQFDGRAVDLGNGWLYNVFTQCLRRHPLVSAWETTSQPTGLEEGLIYITEYDFNRFGCYMPLSKQATFSLIISTKERERLCSMVACAHIMAGVGRDTAMRYYLEKECYEDNEITFAALRKHYQRHYRHYEDSIMHDIKELRTQNRHKR